MAEEKSTDLFGIPDTLNSIKKKRADRSSAPRQQTNKRKVASTSQTKPDRKAAQKMPAPALPGQGFLPGLSRRGRPRLVKPISAVERTAEHRRKRIENGAKRVEIILESDVFQSLDRLAEHHKEPRSDVIASLIRKAAARLKR